MKIATKNTEPRLAEDQARWKRKRSEVCVYMFAAVPSRMVHVLHNTEQMASCVAILDTGTCVVADSSFDLLMQKMRGFYAVRKNLRVESRGQRYKLVDFIVKVGSVVLGQTTSFKGLLIEVTAPVS